VYVTTYEKKRTVEKSRFWKNYNKTLAELGLYFSG
jgi:DUF971 family protein